MKPLKSLSLATLAITGPKIKILERLLEKVMVMAVRSKWRPNIVLNLSPDWRSGELRRSITRPRIQAKLVSNIRKCSWSYGEQRCPTPQSSAQDIDTGVKLSH